MLPKRLTDALQVCGQISVQDVDRFAAAGVRVIINNRPDGEEPGQPTSDEIRVRAEAKGVAYRHIPVSGGRFDDAAIAAFGAALDTAPGEVLAFCRSGTRARRCGRCRRRDASPRPISSRPRSARAMISAPRRRIEQRAGAVRASSRTPERAERFDVVIVGGGAGGIATAASILKRDRSVSLAIIEPRTEHFYQPGWTMVGAGVFQPQATRQTMASVMPKGATWIKAAVAGFQPEHNEVTIEDGRAVRYRALVVGAGQSARLGGDHGLSATLGKNGVTSNYRFDLAPYTSRLVAAFVPAGAVHPAADADQVRRRAAKSHVPFVRRLAQSRRPRSHRRRVPQRRSCAFRGRPTTCRPS